jgi:dephospho-CoA kinase
MSIDSKKPIILTFVGMPGSGKSSCVDYLMQKNPGLPPVLYFGGITVDEVKRRGQDVNEANERAVREELRRTEGRDSYAHRIAKKIDNYIEEGHNRIVVDGLYMWPEYKVFKNKYADQAVIVAVAAPRSLRHARLAHRPVRPLTAEEVNSRDYAEIENMEKGGPIANADYTLTNAGSIEDLFKQLEDVLKEIEF